MTLAELYRQQTGDAGADPRTVAAAARRLTPGQLQALELRAQGLSTRAIGQALGVSHGAAAGLVTRALAAMRKRIHGLPRYHRTGRLSQ